MRFLENSFEIVLSPAIVEETVRAFSYPKVRKYIHAGVDPELWFEDGFYWLSSSLVTTSSRASA